MNAGGGRLNAVSLKNLTKICQKITSHKIKISSKKTTSEYDIPYYVTDNSIVSREFGWKPHHDMNTILDERFRWLTDHRDMLKPIFNKNNI